MLQYYLIRLHCSYSVATVKLIIAFGTCFNHLYCFIVLFYSLSLSLSLSVSLSLALSLSLSLVLSFSHSISFDLSLSILLLNIHIVTLLSSFLLSYDSNLSIISFFTSVFASVTVTAGLSRSLSLSLSAYIAHSPPIALRFDHFHFLIYISLSSSSL